MPGVSMRRERSRPRRRDCHFVGPHPNFIRIHAGNALRPRFDTCVEHPFWCAVKGSRFKVPRVPSGDSKEGSMRRVTALTILAAASVLAVTAAQAVPALAIGSPAGGFVIPIGSSASFTNVQFGACNNLTWGYQLNGGANQAQFTFPGGCGTGSGPSVTIGPFATPTSLRVFLTDNVCKFTYYSDGTPVDHVIVSGTNPYSLRFADGGGFCEKTTTTVNNFAGFNFHVDLAISDRAITAAGTGVSAAEGKAFAGQVATFSDVDTNATAADYSATINWGDGATSTGVVSGPGGGPYSVSGSHTYATTGSFTITTTVTDTGGSVAVTSCRTIGFSFAPGGGSFVIGGPKGSLGSSVTFWGAQWAKMHSAGGMATASFKW